MPRRQARQFLKIKSQQTLENWKEFLISNRNLTGTPEEKTPSKEESFPESFPSSEAEAPYYAQTQNQYEGEPIHLGLQCACACQLKKEAEIWERVLSAFWEIDTGKPSEARARETLEARIALLEKIIASLERVGANA